MKKNKKHTKNTQLQTAQGIMVVLAVLAALAGVGALADIQSFSEETRAVETWRMVGFFTFSALFSVLAASPQNNRSLWFIVIANKIALALAGLVFLDQSGVVGASDLLTFDGMLAVFLIIASVLAGVWKKTFSAMRV